MLDEAAMQRIGIDLESFIERGEHERARAHPVIAQQHSLHRGLRIAIELLELPGSAQRLPALRL
jgi:hypothetical protein